MEKFPGWATSMAVIKPMTELLSLLIISACLIRSNSNLQDSCVANAWFEVLSAVHLMAMLTLSEADSLLIPKDHSGSGIRVVSSGYILTHRTIIVPTRTCLMIHKLNSE